MKITKFLFICKISLLSSLPQCALRPLWLILLIIFFTNPNFQSLYLHSPLPTAYYFSLPILKFLVENSDEYVRIWWL
jgi:hypothetical protein